MKRILLSLLLINFINLHAQSKEFCNVYLSQHENETMLEEIYVCGDKFFFKFKYGEIKDAIIKKQNDTSYKIMNIEYMLNQKYLDINKFKENKYYIAIKKDKITLKFIKNNKYKRFYNYPKLKKTIPKYLLQQTNALHKTWGGGLEKFAGGAVGMVAFGALSGGIGAELTGGNFWQGAVTGGIVAGLNYVMHKLGGEDPKPKRSKEDKYSNTKKTAAAVATTLGVLVADDATVVGVIGTVAIAGTAVYDYAKDIDFSKFDFKFDFASEHSKNKRPSNWNKHTKPRSGRSNTKNRQQSGWKPNPNKRIK